MPRQPYAGDTKKLVLGLDIGTTYSGISYSILEPGKVPDIKGVTRFPAQEHVGGNSKIPSILFYDELGTLRAVGAEVLQEHLVTQAEDEGWTKVEWFKLYLRPKNVDTRHMKSLVLPPNLSIVGVYADFLGYLLECAKQYIKESHHDGETLWESLVGNAEYVITHPNGWEGYQQTLIRQAAIKAGLVPDTVEGKKLIHFLTEGEASLHCCIHNGLGSTIAQAEDGVIIADAGGGTIDVSAFAANSPTSFEEISAARCHFQGSVFVTCRATDFLEGRFQNTKFHDDVPAMVEVFDKTTKLRFRCADEPSFIKFGGLRDKDPALGIRAGQLEINGSTVAAFFKPSIEAIMDAIIAQRKSSHKPISTVFLVGGFAASNYLFTTLHSWLQPLGISLSRPDSHVNKAVADGAVSFYLDHFVTTRVARFSCGVNSRILYNPSDPEHVRRIHSTYIDERGSTRIQNSFSVVLKKGTQVSESQTFTVPFYRSTYGPASELNTISIDVVAYRGDISPQPAWTDVDAENFFTLCSIKGDLSSVKKPLQRGPVKRFYDVWFDVNIIFGPAEMTAYLSWKENGATKSGPAEVIYEDTDDS